MCVAAWQPLYPLSGRIPICRYRVISRLLRPLNASDVLARDFGGGQPSSYEVSTQTLLSISDEHLILALLIFTAREVSAPALSLSDSLVARVIIVRHYLPDPGLVLDSMYLYLCSTHFLMQVVLCQVEAMGAKYSTRVFKRLLGNRRLGEFLKEMSLTEGAQHSIRRLFRRNCL